ncbi:ABC transporter permease subunit [Amycolatopsis sp. NPDC059021]|uniref:ABC transporter permease subunit n=1 Tax=Amycolatopsis sp. NPDC059021 TaxID=3346704 RepID=UPI00366A7952
MIWLSWRQFRVQAVAVYGLLLVLAAVLVLAGRPLPGSRAPLDPGHGLLYHGGIVVTYALPPLIGVFWGAPLVARELEAGTHRLAWNQTVTRSEWLSVKLALIGLAAVLAAGLLSLAVTWWADAVDNAVTTGDRGGSFAVRLSPVIFGVRGIAPIGYAVFAFVLGVAVGILLRRTVLAMAVTLVVFAAVQLAVPFTVRPHLLPAAEETVTITASNIARMGLNDAGEFELLTVSGPQGAWMLSNETVDGTGKTVRPPSWLAGCIPPPGGAARPMPAKECFAKLADDGYRQRITYQPAARFWPLQLIETALYLALTALLALLCLRWSRTRLS